MTTDGSCNRCGSRYDVPTTGVCMRCQTLAYTPTSTAYIPTISEYERGKMAGFALGIEAASPPEKKTNVETLAELLQGVQVNIGLRAQGHIPTVEKMRGEGKSWDEIGAVIGWAGHAVEEWYGMEAPSSPQPKRKRLK